MIQGEVMGAKSAGTVLFSILECVQTNYQNHSHKVNQIMLLQNFYLKKLYVCNTDFLALQSHVQSLCFTHLYASRPLLLLTEWVQSRPGPLASSSGQVLSSLGTSISYISCKIQYLYNYNVFQDLAQPIPGITFDSELIKCCPMCAVPIEKDEGCAQMMCKRCKHVFCWYCLASLDVSNLISIVAIQLFVTQTCG